MSDLRCTEVHVPKGWPAFDIEAILPSASERFYHLREDDYHLLDDDVPGVAELMQPEPPSWAEYIAGFDPPHRPYYVAARGWLLNRPGAIPCADEWSARHYLAFSDGKVLAFRPRCWGAFVAAALDHRESYLLYYSRANRQGLPEPSRPAA